MITLLCVLVLGFVLGFYAGVKNAGSSKVALAKEVATKFKR